jgi:glycosyltransferase involved in cell wall biosynthesis
MNDFEISSANKASSCADITDTPQYKLRLCFISNPNIIHTQRWVGWFVKRGHTVCLLADVPLMEPWSEVPIIDLSEIFYARVIRFPVWTLWLKKFLRNWQPDILHAHRVNSAGWLAAASGFHPCVLTPWGSDVFLQPQRSWVARILARYTLRQADLITTISQAIGEQVIQLGARADQLRHIRSGVELDIFSPSPLTEREKIDICKRLLLPADARLVLSPRAVTPIYNLDIILQTIPYVREHIPQAFFIFIDYNRNPDYKRELDESCKKLGLEQYVRWLSPTHDRTEMAKWYSFSDVVVSVPSSDGGTPVSVLEAMACGKPVICSDLPALREFINSGENGWLVPVRQVTPLAEAIVLLLSRSDLAKEFGQRSSQLVAQKANFEIEMQTMETMYLKLVSSRRM